MEEAKNNQGENSEFDTEEMDKAEDAALDDFVAKHHNNFSKVH